MSAGTVLTVFCVIAIAELPDKTMIATLVMGARGMPLWVWLGASAAFLVHVGFAVVAGQLLTRLPHTALEVIVTVLFAGGAAWLLFVPEREEVERGEREALAERVGRPRQVVLAAFGVILVGEFGDLTQLLTVNFVARTHEPWSVALGAGAALLGVSALAAFSGRALVRVVPTSRIRRFGGVVLVGFTAYSVAQLVG
ncbi:MAG TPA: TMEM165/GDT1 family protein [Acidimicrobiales bacterium]|nr:TMEM165/GDT1 family protein [Acidimicrobiales bacterium]